MCKCCIVKCFPEQRTLLKCCCKNIEDEIEEKHPDDIII